MDRAAKDAITGTSERVEKGTGVVTGDVKSSNRTASPRTANLLRVSAYEYVAAAVVTGLLLVGAAVVFMFAIWISSRYWVKQIAVAPQLIEPFDSGGGGGGNSDDLVEPGEEEIETLEPEVQTTLDSITELATDRTLALDTMGSPNASSGKGTGRGRGDGDGKGDGQIPRWDRWQIHFANTSLDEYRRELDHFKIELAAFGGGIREIHYAYKFMAPKPLRRIGHEDNRIYMIWKEGPLAAFDRQLLEKAGVPTKGRIVVQFLPLEVENKLAILEDAAIREKKIPLKQVKKTEFRVRGSASGFDFVVSRVTPR